MTPGKHTIKQVFFSIFVGACVAFISTFFEGVLDFLQGWENNAAGGTAATLTYLKLKHLL